MPTPPTHPLQKADLRSLLLAIAPAPPGTPLATLAESTGLTPAAFRNAIQWAQATHLMDDRGLTPEGHVVATKDPYLEAVVTDWLMHFHLSLNASSLWSYLIYEFLPENAAFTLDELLSTGIKVFVTETSEQLKKNIQLILRTYTEPQAIANNKIITRQGKIYSISNPNLSNVYTVGYVLAIFWEREFKERMAITINELLEVKSGLASCLGLSNEQLKQQLDVLATHEIIEKRSLKLYGIGSKISSEKSLKPDYQLIRKWEASLELLEKAYDNDIATPNQPLIKSLDSILDENDDVPDFSQFLYWASELFVLEGGSNTMIMLAS
jgi:Protein of unknown function (DUF4007)